MKLPKEMRALVYHGKNNLRLETVPVPRIGANDLLVKVATCGVCPTDIKKIQYGTVPGPRIFGHETAGTIVKMGGRVRGFSIGQRVALHHHIPCLDCHACRHRAFAQCNQYKRTGITAGFEPAGGGFAEYVRVMPFVFPGVISIPARNTFEEGAMLEPVNTVLKAVKRLAILPGDTVALVGQGPVGLMFTAILSLKGINVLGLDLMPERIKAAQRFGAKWAISPHDLDKWSKSQRKPVDSAIITAPSDGAVGTWLQRIRGGGQVLLFAHTTLGATVEVDLSLVCVQERDLIGSYSADITLQKAVARMVFTRWFDVRTLVSHRFPLNEARRAIDLASKPTADSLKICVSSADKPLVNT